MIIKCHVEGTQAGIIIYGGSGCDEPAAMLGEGMRHAHTRGLCNAPILLHCTGQCLLATASSSGSLLLRAMLCQHAHIIILYHHHVCGDHAGVRCICMLLNKQPAHFVAAALSRRQDVCKQQSDPANCLLACDISWYHVTNDCCSVWCLECTCFIK